MLLSDTGTLAPTGRQAGPESMLWDILTVTGTDWRIARSPGIIFEGPGCGLWNRTCPEPDGTRKRQIKKEGDLAPDQSRRPGPRRVRLRVTGRRLDNQAGGLLAS